jgi:hypothetical protein
MLTYYPLTEYKAFCSLPFGKIIMNGNGDLSQCCYQLTQLGSVLGDKTVLELWNSPLAKEIRQSTLNGQLHKVCKSWNTCPFLVQEKEVYTSLAHVNFEYPTYLEICLPNTHCNIGGENPNDEHPACIMCCRNYDMVPQPPITDILCEKAKPVMPYLNYLCVLGIAEPFWKDAVFRVFEKVDFKKYRNQIRFTTNTNVICLVERSIERYFDEVLRSDMNFSIDAASAETYQKIRRVDAYDIVIKNLRYYMQHRDRNGGKTRHQTIIYNNINTINVHEMSQMVETAATLGVDKLIMLPTHDQSGRMLDTQILLNDSNLDIFKKAAEQARKRADQLGVNLWYSKSFSVVPPPVGQELAPSQTLVQISL